MTTGKATIGQLIGVLRANGLSRVCITASPDDARLVPSDPCIDWLADTIAGNERDYRGHLGAFFEIGRDSGLLMSAFVHRTERGQAAGGVRFWRYPTVAALVSDGLRLSRGMGQKCALAGLWWGGGKGIIARAGGLEYDDPGTRARVFADYGRFVTGLCGLYVTAEDVGTRPGDMAVIFAHTRFTTCIPPQLGGSGNPGVLTAAGVVVAMEAAFDALGRGTLANTHVALQGLGNVSAQMIGMLLDRGVSRITGCDIDAAAVASVRDRYADERLRVRETRPGDDSILATDCDVLAPNAVGGALNPGTIPAISAPVVCGAANNQLENPDRDADALRDAGILYVPDFLANRMGIVNCANEQYGVLADDPFVRRHLDRDWPDGIYRRCLEIVRRARVSGRSTHAEAAALADELQTHEHPLWPGRGRQIVADLLASDWSRRNPV